METYPFLPLYAPFFQVETVPLIFTSVEAQIQNKNSNKSNNAEYQRKFLIDFAKSHNIKVPEDWSAITLKQVH